MAVQRRMPSNRSVSRVRSSLTVLNRRKEGLTLPHPLPFLVGQIPQVRVPATCDSLQAIARQTVGANRRVSILVVIDHSGQTTACRSDPSTVVIAVPKVA